jgi:hypothetical protein
MRLTPEDRIKECICQLRHIAKCLVARGDYSAAEDILASDDNLLASLRKEP